MTEIVYVNGEYVAKKDAMISVFDRGFLFADGVYEVTTVLDSKLIDFKSHMIRLKRSLDEINMEKTCSDETLLEIHYKLINLNTLKEGFVYLQISRGVAERNFLYPDPEKTKPSLVLFTQSQALIDQPLAKRGAKSNHFRRLTLEKA